MMKRTTVSANVFLAFFWLTLMVRFGFGGISLCTSQNIPEMHTEIALGMISHLE